MATLTEQQRAEAHAKAMREASADHDVFGITKSELRAGIDAADEWINTNAALFNAALPLVVRQNLTAKQKARLLVWVIEKRYRVA